MTAIRSSLALVAVLALAARPAAARDGDVSGMTPLARVFRGLPWRLATEVAVTGAYAYVAEDAGLEIIDLTAPGGATPIGFRYLPGPARDVALAGTLACVAAGDAGLRILDVADRLNPLEVGSLLLSGARSVAVSGNLAFVAEAGEPPLASSGLRVIDVSVPTAPAALGFLALPGGAVDVQVDGSVAWVATGSTVAGPHGLHAVDVSVPASPLLLGSLPTSTPVHEAVVGGGLAYLAAGFPAAGELLVADVSDPSNPALLASVALADAARGLALDGTTVHLAAGRLGLVLFDVTQPAAPVRLGAVATGRDSVAVAALFGTALLAERSSTGLAALTGVDATDPRAPIVVGGFGYSEAMDAASLPALALLLQRSGLFLFDTSNLSAPALLGSFAPAGADFTSLDAEVSLAAIGEGDVVRLVDIVDAANPVEVGRAPLAEGIAIRPVLEGTRLYVATGRGVEVFDVSVPAAPAALGAYPTVGLAAGLAVSGSTGYLASGDLFEVLDLAGPTPVSLGSLSVAGEAFQGVAVDPIRRIAAVTGSLRQLYVIDVSAPSVPTTLASGAAGAGFGVRLVGDRAAVAAGEAGVVVYDLSLPTVAAVEAGQDTSGALYSLASDGPLLILPTQSGQHWLTQCDTCPGAACVPTSPSIGANSLELAKSPPGAVLRWSIGGGCCETNIAWTTDKTRLPLLWQDPAIGSSATTTLLDATPAPAPPLVGHYRAFGRDSCTGASVEP